VLVGRHFDGVDAWRGHVGIPIEGGTVRLADPPDQVGGDGSSRVCNLHDPVWYSRDLPEARPRDEKHSYDRSVVFVQS